METFTRAGVQAAGHLDPSAQDYRRIPGPFDEPAALPGQHVGRLVRAAGRRHTCGAEGLRGVL
eukprot:9037064-Pyramimonas_sp.AAC.1